jgi:TATA-binding protein-associated factor
MCRLRDVDDDVRTVAASALTPITDVLATSLSHDDLCSVIDTLWDCLAEGGDELGISTGAVMDLLGQYPQCTSRVPLIRRRNDRPSFRHDRDERSGFEWVSWLSPVTADK